MGVDPVYIQRTSKGFVSVRDDFIRLENNAVTIFTRKLKSGDVFYARFRIEKRNLADGQRYITESLKTLDEHIAKSRARDRYFEIKFKEKHSQAIKGKFVKDAIHDFLEDYQSRVESTAHGRNSNHGRYTPSMLRFYRKTIERYWLEYCGDMELSSINNDVLEEYEQWRRTYYRRAKDEGRNIHPNSKDNIADSTLKHEYNAMKALMRWALSKNYYTGNEITFKFKARKNKRRAFTLKEYRQLYHYMRRKEFFEKGKHKNDTLIRRSRHQIREYILFMSNTGMRVSEARHLKWRDITYGTENGKKYVSVQIPKNTKTGRIVPTIGRDSARRALERLRNSREDNVGEDDYIFCNIDGTPINSFRDIFNSVIREAGVEYDIDGNKHTIYTLRHTYITFRVKYTKFLDVYSLAKNCHTSVQMIEQYYDDTTTRDHISKLI